MGLFRKREKRSAGGGYSDAIVAAVEAQAAAKVADASSTAAVEAVAGMLSRAFGDAEVIGPEPWVAEAVSPFWLMQVGRSLVREGASLSVVHYGDRLDLVPASLLELRAVRLARQRPRGRLAGPCHDLRPRQ